MSSKSEITIKQLTEFGLITSKSNHKYELSKKFKKDLESPDFVDNPAHSDLWDSPKEKKMLEVCKADVNFMHKISAVNNNTKNISLEKKVKLTLMLDAFIKPKLKFSGTPSAFLPVRGKHLRTALNLFPRSVVYAWRDECSGCDSMKNIFDSIFKREHKGIALFAVYGEDCAPLLDKNFNINGAPTTLFCLNGNIDSRLIGAQNKQSVENEINMIENTTQSL